MAKGKKVTGLYHLHQLALGRKAVVFAGGRTSAAFMLGWPGGTLLGHFNRGVWEYVKQEGGR